MRSEVGGWSSCDPQLDAFIDVHLLDNGEDARSFLFTCVDGSFGVVEEVVNKAIEDNVGKADVVADSVRSGHTTNENIEFGDFVGKRLIYPVVF